MKISYKPYKSLHIAFLKVNVFFSCHYSFLYFLSTEHYVNNCEIFVRDDVFFCLQE